MYHDQNNSEIFKFREYFGKNIFVFRGLNNLSNHKVFTVKHLAADDILFFIVHNAKSSPDELNHGDISMIKLRLDWNGHP